MRPFADWMAVRRKLPHQGDSSKVDSLTAWIRDIVFGSNTIGEDMHPSLSISTFVLSLGVSLSVIAAVYVSTHYIGLHHDVKVVETLAPGEDIMAGKIETLLSGHEASDLVASDLAFRHERAVLLHDASVEGLAKAKRHALRQIILWVGATVLFSVLLVRAESARRGT